MITLDMLDAVEQQEPDVEKDIEALNKFLFAGDQRIFNSSFNQKNTLNEIKAERRLLYCSQEMFLREYIKIRRANTLLEENKLKDIQAYFYLQLRDIALFLTPDIQLSIEKAFESVLEGFSDKEKEIIRDYKGSDKFFMLSEDKNVTKDNLMSEFWQKYFEKFITREDVSSILRYSMAKYDKVLSEKQIFANDMSELVDYKTLSFDFPIVRHLKQIFNLKDSEANQLNVVFAESRLRVSSNYIESLIKSGKHNYIESVNGFFEAELPLYYEIDSLDILYHPEFIKNDIFKEKVSKYTMSYYIGMLSGSKGILRLPGDISLEALIDRYIKFDPLKEQLLTVADFEHIDLKPIVAVVQQNSPKDILLWGAPGFGKSEIANVVIDSLGYRKLTVGVSKASDRVSLLKSAKNIKNNVDKFCIIVDEAEDILNDKDSKFSITKQLETKDVHTFWIINDLEGIHEAYLRRFDYILEINEMPLDKRVDLAQKWLNGNNDLAYKIAQAIHTPAEIKSAVEWCRVSGDYSWANISGKVVNYQRAVAKSAKKDLGDFTIEVTPPNSNYSLKDFAGYHYIKEDAKDILDIFAHPDKYKSLGAKVPKGVLLSGSPGVGKTMFTKCLASELATTLVSADTSALAREPTRIKLLFEKAKAHAPCIVFLDELDVLGSSVVDMFGKVDTEKQKILNQLLVELDGFHSFAGIMVIGATHRAKLLDSALTRSGRFGKKIHFRAPSLADRIEIIKHYCEKVQLADNINYHQLAKLSAAFTSADIAMSVNEAALLAAKNNKTVVSNQDLVDSINQVFFGATMNGMPVTAVEQWKTAIHEAGHALVAMKVGQTPQRATIKPHLNFMGMSQSMGLMTNTGELLSNSLLEKIEAEKMLILNDAKKITTEWLAVHRKELVDFAKVLYEERSLDDAFMNNWFKKNILKVDAKTDDTNIDALIASSYTE